MNTVPDLNMATDQGVDSLARSQIRIGASLTNAR